MKFDGMYTMLCDKVSMIKEQYNDILEGLRCKEINYNLECEYIENEYGGNPTYKVTFNGTINYIPYKEKVFTWKMANKTYNDFVDEIKSYLFDTLDAVTNL